MFLSGNFLKFLSVFKKRYPVTKVSASTTHHRELILFVPTFSYFFFLLGGYIVTSTVAAIDVGARSF